jgi:hypothetical protein
VCVIYRPPDTLTAIEKVSVQHIAVGIDPVRPYETNEEHGDGHGRPNTDYATTEQEQVLAEDAGPARGVILTRNVQQVQKRGSII